MNKEALDAGHDRRWPRICRAAASAAAVLLGIILGQVILYGPSLTGDKVLLPLDILGRLGVYLPPGTPLTGGVPHNLVHSDLITCDEPARRFAAAEIRAGRWPMWAPYEFAGSPLNRPRYSPFWLLGCCTTSPMALAWSQLALALVAGIGTYAFCRLVLGVCFWPATLIAWCFPLTGFFVFWQGYVLPSTIAWLPWLLLAVDKAIRRTRRWGMPALAAVTCLTLVSGQLDIAGHVLLASGIYAIWCLIDRYGKQWHERRAIRAVLTVTAGWTMGFLLAAPYWLPLWEYARTGSRIVHRSEGIEERPPVGLDALPQTVLPDMYGSTQVGSLPLFPKGQTNQMESSAAAYAGLLATLLVAPLAWCSRRHRSINVLWIVLGIISLAWVLDLPGIAVLRLPGLNMMSYNRFVFAASFAVLALAAVGLDVLWRGDIQRGRWFWLPVAVLVGLCAWCVYRSVVLPAPIDKLEDAVQNGYGLLWVTTAAQAKEVTSWFFSTYFVAAVLCGLALAGWLVLWFRPKVPRWFVPALGLLMVGDLLWFGYGRSAQCDPSLYFPRIRVLEEVAASTPGRVMGYQCLPATLCQSHDLRDVRGYDGVDPARFIDLLMIAANPSSPKYEYALTQNYIPMIKDHQFHPVLDMLNVRYLIYRGSPEEGFKPIFSGNDYWVLINEKALPRVYVPERVETVIDDKQRLARLASWEFDPRKAAYVEAPLNLSAPCLGSAEIVDEVPTRVTVSIKMQTAGLVVLADRWDNGWKAYLNGRAAPILRVNHALRGVEAPAGEATLEFRYEPASLAWGLWLSALSLIVCLGWGVATAWLGAAGETDDTEVRRPPENLPKSIPAKSKEKRNRRKGKS